MVESLLPCWVSVLDLAMGIIVRTVLKDALDLVDKNLSDNRHVLIGWVLSDPEPATIVDRHVLSEIISYYRIRSPKKTTLEPSGGER